MIGVWNLAFRIQDAEFAVWAVNMEKADFSCLVTQAGQKTLNP